MSRLYGNNLTEVQMINALITSRFSEISTSFPAQVTAVSYPYVSVQPLIKRAYLDNNNEIQYADYGVLSKMPIVQLGVSGRGINLPIQVGDKGVVVCSQDNTDPLYEPSNRLVPRKFSFSDAIFMPLSLQNDGGSGSTLVITAPTVDINASSQVAITTPDFTVKNGSTIVDMTNATTEFTNTTEFKATAPLITLGGLGTKIAITNGVSEVITVLVAVLTIIENAVIAGTAFDPTTKADIAAQVALLAAFIGEAEQLSFLGDK